MGELQQKAMTFGVRVHQEANHMYGKQPYSYHLQMVFDVAAEHIRLLPTDQREIALAACWVHDAIEDARQTYNDVVKATSVEVADIAYALTNEKGKTRDERGNDKYYEGIRQAGWTAVFVKLCDRIANVRYSKQNRRRGKMFAQYKEEHSHFWCQLHNLQPSPFEPMWDELKKLLGDDD